jgi:hypothetical protein
LALLSVFIFEGGHSQSVPYKTLHEWRAWHKNIPAPIQAQLELACGKSNDPNAFWEKQMVKRSSRIDGLGGSGGQLRITALRGGTVSEVTKFLSDMDGAYGALYSLSLTQLGISPDHLERLLFDGPYPPRRMMEFMLRSGF